MALKVEIESAGDHRFDLIHLRQEGAVELLMLALQRANYRDHPWRLQVQKKVTCHAATRPFAVVGYKPWCCYLKIKPGDNNSGHFCTLLMPPGLHGEEVFRSLKIVEEDIHRNWRFTPDKHPLPANGAAASVAPVEEPRADLTLWVRDAEKTKLILLAIHEVARRGPHASLTEFTAELTEELGWHNATSQDISSVFTALVRRGYITKLIHDSRPIGYQLHAEGREMIRELLTPPPVIPAAGPPVELSFDPTELLQSLDSLAHEYAEAVRQWRENRERRALLQAEIDKLDAEARVLDRKVNNSEVKGLLRRLNQLNRHTS